MRCLHDEATRALDFLIQRALVSLVFFLAENRLEALHAENLLFLQIFIIANLLVISCADVVDSVAGAELEGPIAERWDFGHGIFHSVAYTLLIIARRSAGTRHRLVIDDRVGSAGRSE